MKFSKVIYTCILVSYLNFVNSELYSSVEQLNTFIDQLHVVTIKLTEYIDNEYERLHQLERHLLMLLVISAVHILLLLIVPNLSIPVFCSHLADYSKLTQQSKVNPTKFLGNPINVYRLIKKLTKNYNEIKSLIRNRKISEYFSEFEQANKLPTHDDYTDTALYVSKLHDIYLLNFNDTRLGQMNDKYPNDIITAYECYELGIVAFENHNYYHTVNWMVAALDQLDLEGDNYTIFVVPVLEYFANATAQEGNVEYAIEINKAILQQIPENEKAKQTIEILTEQLGIKSFKNETVYEQLNFALNYKHQRPNEQLIDYNYEALCRQEYDQLQFSSEVSCRYLTNTPKLAISPIKEEKILDSPEMYLYHDVILEKHIDRVKSLLSNQKLYEVNNTDVGNALNFISKFLNDVSHIRLSDTDDWILNHYGFGGEEILDSINFEIDPYSSEINYKKKQRLAMLELFFEVPEKGGATVFPDIYYHIKAPRKSALLYFNSNQNSTTGNQLRHYECPILYGSKMIAKKSIYNI